MSILIGQGITMSPTQGFGTYSTGVNSPQTVVQMKAVPPLAVRKTKRQLVTSFGFVVGPPGGMPSPSRSFAPGYSSCTSRTAMFVRPRKDRVSPSPAPVVGSTVVSVATSTSSLSQLPDDCGPIKGQKSSN